MGKFNRAAVKTAIRSVVHTETTPSGATAEGGPGYARDAKSELFLLAVSNLVGEQTFYEHAANRDTRYEQLVHTVAVADPEWTAGFLRWLRGEGNMRSASLVGALEAAKAMVAAGVPGSRQIVASVLQRADEPGEALAYWLSRHGRAIPKPVKRGIADAVAPCTPSTACSSTTPRAGASGSPTCSTWCIPRRSRRGRRSCSCSRSPAGTVVT